jgi:hypothetical protein
MKVLFTALHFAYFRNFESVIRLLAQRGHTVHLAADEPETFGGQALVERLASEYPAVTWGWVPSAEGEAWFPAAQKLRYALDYVRYLDPRYDAAEKLRLRNIQRTPRIVRWLTPRVGGRYVGHRSVAGALKWIERALPRNGDIERWIQAQSPDVVLLASLTYSRSTSIEQLKVARASGIPVGASVMSWDHLSSKALLHVAPDVTLVWNDVQKREAVDMHGMSADRVVVTGAQCYDQWFSRQPTRTRDEFCADLGLDPSRPFVLYVCSAMSPVPSPIEPAFVKEWVTALRQSPDPVLRDAGVVIRPHPERVKEWNGISLDGLDNVVMRGRNPIEEGAKSEYFDSLYHSAAVVGLCTSAFLEAAIAGKPVLTLQLPAYRIHQDGAAHFRYLLNLEGGLLRSTTTLEQHLRDLSTALASASDERTVPFLTRFIRPAGLDVAATPVFVDAVERLAASGRSRPDRSLSDRPAVRTLVGRVAVAANEGVGRWLMMDAFDVARERSERDRARDKDQLIQTRAAYRESERQARDTHERAKEQSLREKRRKKWLRQFSARKQVARLKGSVKQLLVGARGE